MIIVLEGLEGVGKTTLALRLAQESIFDYIKTPHPMFNPVRSHISKMESKQGRFYFYLSTLFDIQSDLERYRKDSSQHVLVDRYILSTIAYHNYGIDFNHPVFEDSKLLMADITICIECSETTRQARLKKRGLHIYEREKFHNENIRDFFKSRCDVSLSNEENLEKSAKYVDGYLSNWLLKNE